MDTKKIDAEFAKCLANVDPDTRQQVGDAMDAVDNIAMSIEERAKEMTGE